jgi:hypothetical protein
VVSRVIAEADRAAEPKNSSNAGTKSPDDNPCSYGSGNTSVTFGLFRHQDGKISERNLARPPVLGPTRLSLIRGAATSAAPAAVVTDRGRACPLLTTDRRPSTPTSPANPAKYASTSASNAAVTAKNGVWHGTAVKPCSGVKEGSQ